LLLLVPLRVPPAAARRSIDRWRRRKFDQL